MSKSVFYAWQSDLPERCGRYFIRDAAEAAIKALRAELAVDDAPRLDHDTKGLSGTPDIARAIFDKIDACDVFLADVSLVATADTPGSDGQRKRVPNPNVLIELGYALRAVGHDRVVLVMNTAFGLPEELPFDLRGRRHPILYHLPAPDHPDRKAVLAQLTEALRACIRAVIERAPLTGAAAEREAQRLLAARQWVTEERQRFEDSALRNQFHGFEPARGALLVSVIPERPLSPPLDLGDPTVQRVRLGSIYGHHADAPTQPRGQSLIAVTRVDETTPPCAATELRRDGVLLATDGLLLEGGNTEKIEARFKKKIAGLVPAEFYELRLTKAVGSYVKTLRGLGVRGPLHVGISLFRIQGFMMGADTYGMMMGHGVHQYQGNGIAPDLVVFDEGADVSSNDAVARRLRPAFDWIWREFGHAASLNFDAAGAWKHG